jgi:hypothetical protein
MSSGPGAPDCELSRSRSRALRDLCLGIRSCRPVSTGLLLLRSLPRHTPGLSLRSGIAGLRAALVDAPNGRQYGPPFSFAGSIGRTGGVASACRLRAKRGRVSVTRVQARTIAGLSPLWRPFHPSKRTALYCRPLCRQEARRVRRDGQRYYARKQREREMKPIACAVCGHEMMFPPTRSTRRYCSNACRQYAYRHRQPSAAQIKARIDRGMRRRDRFARAARMRSHRPLAR